MEAMGICQHMPIATFAPQEHFHISNPTLNLTISIQMLVTTIDFPAESYGAHLNVTPLNGKMVFIVTPPGAGAK